MFEILGFEKFEFTNQETGEFVEGYKLYLKGDKLTSKGSAGVSVLCKFFPLKNITGEVKVGALCEFKVSFSSDGKPKLKGVSIS